MWERYLSNLTAASFWPLPPNMLVLRENVSPVFVFFFLSFILIEPSQSIYEDIDIWCEQYHPNLSHSECLDEAGLWLTIICEGYKESILLSLMHLEVLNDAMPQLCFV